LISEAVRAEDIEKSPVVYFLMGLIEGFVQFMAEDRVVLTPKEVQKGNLVFSYS